MPNRTWETAMADGPITLLRLPGVIARVGLARSRIYELMATGSFPKPVRLSCRTVAWISSEVDEWISSRIRETRGDRDAA